MLALNFDNIEIGFKNGAASGSLAMPLITCQKAVKGIPRSGDSDQFGSIR